MALGSLADKIRLRREIVGLSEFANSTINCREPLGSTVA